MEEDYETAYLSSLTDQDAYLYFQKQYDHFANIRYEMDMAVLKLKQLEKKEWKRRKQHSKVGGVCE